MRSVTRALSKARCSGGPSISPEPSASSSQSPHPSASSSPSSPACTCDSRPAIDEPRISSPNELRRLSAAAAPPTPRAGDEEPEQHAAAPSRPDGDGRGRRLGGAPALDCTLTKGGEAAGWVSSGRSGVSSSTTMSRA